MISQLATPEADLAERLEELLALPLADESDLPSWHDKAATLKADLRGKFSGLPNDLHWETVYFLHDSDIRLHEADYARSQEEIMRRLIARLRDGEVHLAYAR